MPLSRQQVDDAFPAEMDLLRAELDDEIQWKTELADAGAWALEEVMPVVAVIKPRRFPGDDRRTNDELEVAELARLQAISMMQFCAGWGSRKGWVDRQKRYARTADKLRRLLPFLSKDILAQLRRENILGDEYQDSPEVRRVARTKGNFERVRARGGQSIQVQFDHASDMLGEEGQLWCFGIHNGQVICRSVAPAQLGLAPQMAQAA